MNLKKFLPIFLLLFSVCVLAQSNISMELLKKNKSGKYILINTEALYTGLAYRTYDNGQVGMSGAILNGQFDKKWIWWYKDGEKKRETTYKQGLKHGYSYWWHKNGVKKSEIKFSENKNIMQYKWDENGNEVPPPIMNQE